MTKGRLQIIALLAQDQSAWAVMTALRGPDMNGSILLKYVTTSVLRHFVGMESDLHCVISHPEEAKDIWRDALKGERSNTRRQWENSHHFRGHIRKAFAAIGGEAEEYASWMLRALHGLDEDNNNA